MTKSKSGPRVPLADNADNVGTPIEYDTENGPVSFRWRGRYFPGAMRQYREAKRSAAEARHIDEPLLQLERRYGDDSTYYRVDANKPKAKRGGAGAKQRRRARRSERAADALLQDIFGNAK